MNRVWTIERLSPGPATVDIGNGTSIVIPPDEPSAAEYLAKVDRGDVRDVTIIRRVPRDTVIEPHFI